MMGVRSYAQDRLLLSHKKEGNIAICSNIDGPRDYHTKWRKSDKDKYDIIYMWNLKAKYKWIYIYKAEGDSQT